MIFKGWYTYNDTKERMFQGNNPKAYDILINNTDRTVYLTLNYFREDYKPFYEFQDRGFLEVEGWKPSHLMMLSVDIDIEDGSDIPDPKVKEALETITKYTYNKLS